MKRLIVIAFALTMALFLAACGDNSEEVEEPGAIDGSQIEVDPEDAEVSEEEKVDADIVVVSINGNDITGDAYNDLYAQTKSILAYQGQDTSDQEELQEHVMNALVERELLAEEANKEGINISEEAVEKFKDENEERYEAVLEQYNLTSEEYDKQLAFELLLDEYVTTVFPVSEVTDEEIKELYDEAKEGTDGLPELEEVEEQLKEMFVLQQVTEKMKEWKEAADIDMKL